MNTLALQNNNNITNNAGIGAETFTRFIKYIDASPKTIETYTRWLKQLFKYFADNNITYPTRDDMIAFKEELKAAGHKPTTVQNYITVAKLFFKWAEQEGIYPNIADHLKGVKLNRDHKKDYLTSGQVKGILDGLDKDTAKAKRDYAIFFLTVTGGLRTVEIVRANIEDLRTAGDSTVLYIQGKGKEEKTDYVKIPLPVERAIRDYLKERKGADVSEPLFVSASNNNTGKRITTRTIRDIIKKQLRAAGYDSERLTAHSLRHTAVTLSLLAGKDITEVQQFARHANLNTTMIYNHALDKAKNGCSEAVLEAILG